MIKVVLDTNIICASISLSSPYRLIFDLFEEDKYKISVSTSILLEYIEKLEHIFSETTARDFDEAIKSSAIVEFTNPRFSFDLIKSDPDDNKFVDCYLASGANYLVTNDKHYGPLKKLDFPKINILTIEEFYELLRSI